MFHTERDVALFMAELLLLLGAIVTALYAVLILTALVYKAFSSLRSLYMSFFISTLATVPFVGAMALRWPYLTELKSIETTPHVLSLINAVLLGFAWMAPSIQWVRSK